MLGMNTRMWRALYHRRGGVTTWLISNLARAGKGCPTRLSTFFHVVPALFLRFGEIPVYIRLSSFSEQIKKKKKKKKRSKIASSHGNLQRSL